MLTKETIQDAKDKAENGDDTRNDGVVQWYLVAACRKHVIAPQRCAPRGRVDTSNSVGRAEHHKLVTVRSQPSTIAIWIKCTTRVLPVQFKVGHGWSDRRTRCSKIYEHQSTADSLGLNDFNVLFEQWISNRGRAIGTPPFCNDRYKTISSKYDNDLIFVKCRRLSYVHRQHCFRITSACLPAQQKTVLWLIIITLTTDTPIIIQLHPFWTRQTPRIITVIC